MKFNYKMLVAIFVAGIFICSKAIAQINIVQETLSEENFREDFNVFTDYLKEHDGSTRNPFTRRVKKVLFILKKRPTR